VSRLPRPPDASSSVAVGALVVANLLPPAGVLWFGRGVFGVLAGPLVAEKTGFDAVAHLREHRRRSADGPPERSETV
jgi:hypothetical protein